ncbi:hypothetical protein RIEPE_0329 [Candidatus Riesia pediculicola USDA]|uniref:Uncharacterized protein n=1 Tax=Riesia pediculicola (strain USDA) TaxID=515618 RepID=D4G8C2_RIEPU|nr:hypothetical protein RIEPE_0329 [Candidatus Riesia pediculicola USDA]
MKILLFFFFINQFLFFISIRSKHNVIQYLKKILMILKEYKVIHYEK